MIGRGWIIKAALLGGLLLFGAAAGSVLAQEPAANAGWWLPENASAHGKKIDALFTLIFVVTSVTMIAVFVFLIYLLIRYRHRPGRRVAYVHGNHRLEVIWTLTPAVLLVVLGILSLRVWADVTLNPPDPLREDVTEVEVLAQQFQWNIRYPGWDGKFGTADDIGSFDPRRPALGIAGLVTVPVGKSVRVHLMSRDVLHSFFLPNMRMKRDAVPGLRTEIYFTPTQTGMFDIACAELCGPQHYVMAGKLIVLSQEEYDAWLDERMAEVDERLAQEGYFDEQSEDEEMEEGQSEELEEGESGEMEESGSEKMDADEEAADDEAADASAKEGEEAVEDGAAENESTEEAIDGEEMNAEDAAGQEEEVSPTDAAGDGAGTETSAEEPAASE